MPRRVAEPPKPEDEPQSEAEPKDGAERVTFIKNQVGEVIVFEDKTTCTLKGSSETFTDPGLIEKLRRTAALPGNPYGLFEKE